MIIYVVKPVLASSFPLNYVTLVPKPGKEEGCAVVESSPLPSTQRSNRSHPPGDGGVAADCLDTEERAPYTRAGGAHCRPPGAVELLPGAEEFPTGRQNVAGRSVRQGSEDSLRSRGWSGRRPENGVSENRRVRRGGDDLPAGRAGKARPPPEREGGCMSCRGLPGLKERREEGGVRQEGRRGRVVMLHTRPLIRLIKPSRGIKATGGSSSGERELRAAARHVFVIVFLS
ncbi:uncharacterized protein LOC127423553 [Myxocyprinus asiaticus]|uniref:uncharacterized protein LOC127423553 n=1 Tax=Myxocyprinus asiaticus TaxID=70543 RepID=UPI002221561A|nr:uncharacterized protein LOC127423553 [Myxocyprinus asiaticus]